MLTVISIYADSPGACRLLIVLKILTPLSDIYFLIFFAMAFDIANRVTLFLKVFALNSLFEGKIGNLSIFFGVVLFPNRDILWPLIKQKFHHLCLA
mmetsp:Transcript_13447/g.22006  ORF Transcript_13447/g.22006 Transcript_13447/m.22006 type:complete len:96 (-) Transcript_13447:1123-1410(-)